MYDLEICFNLKSGFSRTPKGRFCQSNGEEDAILKAFTPRRTIPNPSFNPSLPVTDENFEDAKIARNDCEGWCSNDPSCWGCSVVCGVSCLWNALSYCGTIAEWTGLIEGDITQKSGKMMKSIISKW